jgi:HAD superfamily hydrolase (TIGR01509 family)
MSPPPSDLASLPGPQAVIFDLDGTLVDTVETRIEAWMRVFSEEGIAADRRHVAELIGSDGKRLAREVAGELSDERAEAIDSRSGAIYSELNRSPRPLPGAREVCVALDAAGIRWAIATSSRREQVGASVAALELPREPRIVDGQRVEQAKPAPDLLLHTAQRLEVEPSDCWYVGDSTWDMQAARAAGMVAIAVTAGAAVSSDALRGAGAHAVLESLTELQAAVSGR